MENGILRPFDTVVNFYEDFSSKIDESNQSGASSSLQKHRRNKGSKTMSSSHSKPKEHYTIDENKPTVPVIETCESPSLYGIYQQTSPSSLPERSYSPPERDISVPANAPITIDSQSSTNPGISYAIDERGCSLVTSHATYASEVSNILNQNSCEVDFSNTLHNDGQSVIGTDIDIQYSGKVMDHEMILNNHRELSQLKMELEQRSKQVETLTQQLTSLKRDEQMYKVYLSETNQKNSVKTDVVLSLKKRLAELNADHEALRCAHQQALDRQLDLQEEVENLRRTRNWFSEQVHMAQTGRSRFQEEINRLHTILKGTSEHNHRLSHQVACLEAQLACSKAATINANRALYKKVADIRNDMIEREAFFKQIGQERLFFQSICREKEDEVKRLEEHAQTLLTDLNSAEARFQSQKQNLSELENSIKLMESKHQQLQNLLSASRDESAEKERQLNELTEKYNITLDQISQLDKERQYKEGLLSQAMEEKSILTLSLQSTKNEKDLLGNQLMNLKDNLTLVEETLNELRFELNMKQSSITSLTEERDELQQKISVFQNQLYESSCLLESVQREKEQLLATTQYLHSKISSYQHELTSLKSTSKVDAPTQTSHVVSPVHVKLDTVSDIPLDNISMLGSSNPMIANNSQFTISHNEMNFQAKHDEIGLPKLYSLDGASDTNLTQDYSLIDGEAQPQPYSSSDLRLEQDALKTTNPHLSSYFLNTNSSRYSPNQHADTYDGKSSIEPYYHQIHASQVFSNQVHQPDKSVCDNYSQTTISQSIVEERAVQYDMPKCCQFIQTDVETHAARQIVSVETQTCIKNASISSQTIAPITSQSPDTFHCIVNLDTCLAADQPSVPASDGSDMVKCFDFSREQDAQPSELISYFLHSTEQDHE